MMEASSSQHQAIQMQLFGILVELSDYLKPHDGHADDKTAVETL
jgi:hypothetical protein